MGGTVWEGRSMRGLRWVSDLVRRAKKIFGLTLADTPWPRGFPVGYPSAAAMFDARTADGSDPQIRSRATGVR